MNGLWIKENQHFAVLLDALLPEFETLWWYCSIQAWPIDARWLYGNEETGDVGHEDVYDDCFFDAKCLRNCGAWIWCPKTLPMLAPYLYLDEWSTLIGFKAEENEVELIASQLSEHKIDFAEEHAVVERFAEVYILDIDDGLFHIYSLHEEWLQRLHKRWRRAERIEAEKWRRDQEAELQREMEKVQKKSQSMSKYEIVIGMEVHAELLTNSKQFCACANTALAEPNTHVCPVCLGFPGSLPVLNAKGVDLALRTVLAFDSNINRTNIFERKNYFYPDLPKAYQTTQAMLPLGKGGFIEIDVPQTDADGTSSTRTKRVTLHDVHMEEDTGKSQHGESIGDPFSSLVDYNRAGIPLLEIVSNPDMRSVEEAEAYMTSLRQLLLYLEVSDCKMEQGRLRFEASVSLRPFGAEKLGTRVEVKNLNSMKSVRDSLKAEIARQERVLDDGGTIQQMTMLWDEASGTTQPMRSKEQAHDYRYFPEPDLVPLSIDDVWLERVRREMPELPRARKMRFQSLGLSPYEADVLTASRELADYYEAVLRGFEKADGTSPKTVSNWVSNELLGRLNADGKTVVESPVAPEKLRELLQLLDAGTISGKTAKEVFDEMFASGRDAQGIVAEKGLTQMSDTSELEAICAKVIEANAKAAQDFREGKERSFGALVGGVMKETKGRANPSLVNDLLRKLLAS